MSPASNNEPASLNLDEAVSATDVAETGLLCETPAGKLPKETLRRDISSGETVGTGGLIRFVVSPDGALVPDVAHKLPGRGLWVNADRASLETAIKRNIFAKAAKRQVKAAPELVASVHAQLRRRCLDLLGLARREGGLLTGFEKVLAGVKSGKAAWLIEARDGAVDGRTRILAAIKAVSSSGRVSSNLCGCFDNAELSLALGAENAIHVALLAGRRVERWSLEMKRLSGFEPLVPPGWAHGPEPGG
jgi:predicted RNA-binding protein YlxR (DUF448 family)